MEKISALFVIPVFNVSKFLKKCVHSLISQDYREIEIILVDDGSTDGSGISADQLALIDDRIHVIHQENKGVSKARNAGLRIAKGDYVTVLQLVDNVGIGDKRIYHQTNTPEKAIRKFNLESNLCGLRLLEIQKLKWKKQSSEIELQWMYNKYKFHQSILNGIVRSEIRKQYPEVLMDCIRGVRTEIKIPMKCESNMVLKNNWSCYYLAPLVMAIRAARKHNRYAPKYGQGGGRLNCFSSVIYIPFSFRAEGVCA